MEEVWNQEDPIARFWKRLKRDKALELMRCSTYLKSLRNNFEQARQDQKRFGHVWKEYGVTIYDLIGEACGENWNLDPPYLQKKSKGNN